MEPRFWIMLKWLVFSMMQVEKLRVPPCAMNWIKRIGNQCFYLCECHWPLGGRSSANRSHHFRQTVASYKRCSHCLLIEVCCRATTVIFEVTDGRMVFAIPRLNKDLYRNNHTVQRHRGKCHASQADVDYLVDAVKPNFEGVNLKASHRCGQSWAGRTAPYSWRWKIGSELSKRRNLCLDFWLISIAGDKHRLSQMAERVFGYGYQNNFTERDLKPLLYGYRLPSPKNPFTDYDAVKRYRVSFWSMKAIAGIVFRLPCFNYGRQTDDVIAYLEKLRA